MTMPTLDSLHVIAALDANGNPVAVSPTNPLPGTGAGAVTGLARSKYIEVPADTDTLMSFLAPGVRGIEIEVEHILGAIPTIAAPRDWILAVAVDAPDAFTADAWLDAAELSVAGGNDINQVRKKALVPTISGSTSVGIRTDGFFPIDVAKVSSGNSVLSLYFRHSIAGVTLGITVTAVEEV